jgi:DNA-binding transcriptional ArsR family regulator
MLNHEARLDLMFHALADPNRRIMLQRLDSGPCSVSDLARPLSMSLAGVVQHVQILEVSGLISSSKVGRTRTCRLNRTALSAVEQWIADRHEHVEHQLDRLDALLKRNINKETGEPND